MVYPVNRASSRVLEKLSKAPRVRNLGLQYSSGWHETADRKKGYFEVGSAVPDSWDGVILQGPHFTVANPFAKQPNPTMKNNLDWTELDLEALPTNFIPRTSYQVACDEAKYAAFYGSWIDGNGDKVPVRKNFRIAWRRMAGISGVRALNPALYPPGTAAVDNVYTAALPQSPEGWTDLLYVLGVMSSVVADFLVKVGGASKINPDIAGNLPAARNPLLEEQMRPRVLRLNCLTEAYAPLWQAFETEDWSESSPARVASERRSMMIEIDALVGLLVGLDAEEVCTIYRTQFPVLVNYEKNDLYDANGRKVPGDIARLYKKLDLQLSIAQRTWKHPQSGVEYVFELPFQSFDREEDVRKAYAHSRACWGRTPDVGIAAHQPSGRPSPWSLGLSSHHVCSYRWQRPVRY
jgi:hypothetical protein